MFNLIPHSTFAALQSVVEGTDFRFEEIRSVGYFIAGNKRHLIPEKAKVVNINFRSHAGIHNCASAFLDLLFEYFPGSAKQLKKDHGLFKGARPGVFHNVEIQQLSSLLKDTMQGCVILTHDETAVQWREVLGHPLVYGIRESKGLEFKSVIILDFFGEIQQPLQKAWRNLLLGREGPDFQLRHPLVETHLKLIYTAITRCIEQLFFAETTSSIAGNAAIRWLTTSKQSSPSKEQTDQITNEAIATTNDVSDLDSMMMTNDEFSIAGINNAELAESTDIEPEQAISYLTRAIYCFEKAQNQELLSKANAHLLSVELRCKHVDIKSLERDGLDAIEVEAAQVTKALLEEHLLSECLELLKFVSPYLSKYAQDQLDEHVIRKIQFGNIETTSG